MPDPVELARDAERRYVASLAERVRWQADRAARLRGVAPVPDLEFFPEPDPEPAAAPAPPPPPSPAAGPVSPSRLGVTLRMLTDAVARRRADEPDRAVEWDAYLASLAPHVRPDGSLPEEFADLVDEVFGDLLG